MPKKYIDKLTQPIISLKENSENERVKSHWEDYKNKIVEKKISIFSFLQLVIYNESGAYKEINLEGKIKRLQEYLEDNSTKKKVHGIVEGYYKDAVDIKQKVKKVYDCMRNFLSKDKKEGTKILKYLIENKDEVLNTNNLTAIAGSWRYYIYVNPLFYLLGLLEIKDIKNRNKEFQIYVNEDKLNRFLEIVPKQINEEEKISSSIIDPTQYDLNKKSRRKAEFLYILQEVLREKGIVDKSVKPPLNKAFYEEIKKNPEKVESIINLANNIGRGDWKRYRVPCESLPDSSTVKYN